MGFLPNIRLDLSCFCNITTLHIQVDSECKLSFAIGVFLGLFRKVLAVLNCKFLRREVWTVRLIKKFVVHTLTKVTLVITKVIKASVRRY